MLSVVQPKPVCHSSTGLLQCSIQENYNLSRPVCAVENLFSLLKPVKPLGLVRSSLLAGIGHNK